MLAPGIYWNFSMFTRQYMNACYTVRSITYCSSGLSVFCGEILPDNEIMDEFIL